MWKISYQEAHGWWERWSWLLEEIVKSSTDYITIYIVHHPLNLLYPAAGDADINDRAEIACLSM